MDIREIIIASYVVLCIVADVIFLLIRLTKFYTCRKIENCKNRKCLVSETCRKYDKSLTQEEYDYLIQLVKKSFPEERDAKNENIQRGTDGCRTNRRTKREIKKSSETSTIKRKKLERKRNT